jgi:hypothetical protein
MPITAFIGVRISWLILARNIDFERVASSAISLASRIACSAAFRSEMSLIMVTVAINAPASLRIALVITSAHSALEQAAHALSKVLYEATAQRGGTAPEGAAAEAGGKGPDDAIDAEFEVKG